VLLNSDEGRTLVKQFVRSPRPRSATEGAPLGDAQLAFLSAVDGGLGLATANAFLLLAGREAVNEDHCAEGRLWISTADRRRQWRSARVLRHDGASWHLQLLSGESTDQGNLRCRREAVADVIVGENAEDLLRLQIARHGLGSPPVAAVLERWREEAALTLQAWRSRGVQFDVMPNNYILRDGLWHMIDTEFTWQQPLSDEVCLYRALWYTAERLVESGDVLGEGVTETTLEGLVVLLAEDAGLTLGPDVFEQWIAFEVELQAIVRGWPEETRQRHAEVLRSLKDRAIAEPDPRRELQQALLSNKALTEHVQQQQDLIDRVHAVLDDTRVQWSLTQQELDRQRLLLDLSHQQLATLRADMKALQRSTSWRVTAPLRRIRKPGR
jgi:hypothetical protein